jgi:hypothetical protein
MSALRQAFLTEVFRGFTQFLQANSEIVPQISPRSLHSVSSPIHNQLNSISFDVICYEVLRVVLKIINKHMRAFGIEVRIASIIRAINPIMIEAVRTSETSVNETTRRCVPEVAYYYSMFIPVRFTQNKIRFQCRKSSATSFNSVTWQLAVH